MNKNLIFLFILILPIILSACSFHKNTNNDLATNVITSESTTQREENTTLVSETTNITDEENKPSNDNNTDILNYTDVKAVWLSQFDLNSVYTDDSGQRNVKDFTQRIKIVINNMKEYGFNTLIVQIRPYADSFYPSEIYPPSKYVVGSYKNDFSYDPIKIIIEEAHKANLSVHAWINPLRCMTTDEIKDVNSKYQIKKWFDSDDTMGYYVVETNGRLYLNPAYKPVRDLIVSGVNEIITKYSFDGVHMDDYFYPTPSPTFDTKAYEEYKKDSEDISLKKFRHEMLNLLVSEIFNTVKNNNTKKLFGISPSGNMNTVINESFADVYTWCKEDGYIDYISPQIYFGLEHQTFPFAQTLDDWADIIINDKVSLVVGITLGKAFSKEDKWAGSGKNEWKENNDIINKCLQYTGSHQKCSGVSFFCYRYFFDPLTNAPINETKEEVNNMLPTLRDLSWQ